MARTRTIASVGAGGTGIDDLFERDRAGDAVVATTRRGLCRVAVVAAEAASRFQREGLDGDPVDWMLRPRRLFGGAAALDACLEPEAFGRAVLLHALSMGLDAEPDEVERHWPARGGRGLGVAERTG